MTIKTMEDHFMNRERLEYDCNSKLLSMFFSESEQKYGIALNYVAGPIGLGIGVEYTWPECPKDENTVKSIMITEYQFKQFSYGITVQEDPHDILFLIFKYRGRFYINFVIINEDNTIRQAELMAFDNQQEMLEIADNEFWIDFQDEVRKFLMEQQL